MKMIAMYLPQFHQIPENDRWWGKGFTEWTAVRSAERLFEGHDQPREPLNDDYYDLLDRSAMDRQAKLAKQYGLDGFCFYHYYFKSGKKVLEKPAENLLQWTDIDMPFCFCWANESWGRTWSRLDHRYESINSWTEKTEGKEETEKKSNGILLEQRYGREKEWKAHFDYLLPFFKDKRYIKKDGAPVFLIYKPQQIKCLAEMICFWKRLARQEGLGDIYLIGENCTRRLKGLDGILLYGPLMYQDPKTGGHVVQPRIKNGVRTYSYQKLWENAIAARPVSGCKTYFGGFTDYDDTPRHGKNGSALEGASAELFEKYLYLLVKKNQMAQNGYTFINAFNEWGEGMYLEPDKKRGYRYLEAVKEVKERISSEQMLFNHHREGASEECEADEEKYKSEKNLAYVQALDKWMGLREQGIHLSDYLKRYHYGKVAVYGIGILGRHLVKELLEDGVDIRYLIDKKENVLYPGIATYRLADDLPAVDVIIVTAIYEYQYGEIWDDIRKYNMDCPIVSLAEMIFEV